MSRILLLKVVVILFAFSSVALSSPMLIHFDMKQECVPSHKMHGIATAFSRFDVADIQAYGRSQGYGVTGSGNMGAKSRDAQAALNSTIIFFDQLGWAAPGVSEPMLLLSNLGDGNCNGVNASYMGLNNRRHVMTIEYGHPNSQLSMADDDDNASHEYGHSFFGRFTSSRTQEVGAINESVADMFGAAYRAWATTGQQLNTLVAREDSFIVGEQWARIMRRYYQGNMFMMRNMADPAFVGDPDYYDESTARSAEIHSLGGITNLAFYLMSQGGRHPRITNEIVVPGIGLEKSIKIIFYTIRHGYPFTNMPEFGDAVRIASRRMYGNESPEFLTVDLAFKAVNLRPIFPFETRPAQQEEPEEEPEEVEPAENSEPAEEAAQPEEREPPVAPVPNDEVEPAPETEHAEPRLFTITGPSFIIILFSILGGGVITVLMIASRYQRHSINPQPVAYEYPANVDVLRQSPLKDTSTHSAQKVSAQSGSDSSVASVLRVQGEVFDLVLDASPLTLGRNENLDLPKLLKVILSKDLTISRTHCAIWYKKSTNELYVQCLSDQGLFVAQRKLASSAKVKIDFNKPITVMLGKTQFQFEPLV